MNFLKKENCWWVASFGVLAGITIAAFTLPGGDDLYRYYQPFAQGCLDCGFVPYFAQWFLWPLLLLHYPLAWIAAYPLFQANAMQFAWVLPLSLLFSITLKELRERRQPPNQKKGIAYA